MLLRKYMSLIGIGSPKIDLILEKETYRPGEQVKGYFLIKGGTIKQQLKRIDCDLIVYNDEEENEKTVDFTTILTNEHIHSDAINEVPFTFRLPESTEVSTKSLAYRFKTKLSFQQGVESVDQDLITIIVE